MEKLLKSLRIDENADAEAIVGKLELKQSEIMERLDNVEDEARRQKLKGDLKEIEAAITAFSWMRGKKQAGIARDEDVISEDFSDLKRRGMENAPVERQKGKTQEELFNKACAMLRTPDCAKGVETIRSLAESGYVPAMFEMGILYHNGDGVAQDKVKAAGWYRKAAEQGNVDAQCCLAQMYDRGDGIAVDKARAEEWYRKAADQGHEEARTNLNNLITKNKTDAKNAAAAAQPVPSKAAQPAPSKVAQPASPVKKKKVRKKGKLFKILRAAVIIILIGSACPSYIGGIDMDASLVRCFSPNILYAEEQIGQTPSPWYISLRPMNHLQIDDDAENMSYVMMLFGARYIHIAPAIKRIDLRDGTISVHLNCERLEELTVPDSVAELELYNLKDELALALELPKHLEKLSISGPDLTDTGFQALNITGAEYVSINNCSNLKNINISGDIGTLKIVRKREENANILNVNIDGNVQTLVIPGIDTVNVTVNGNGYLEFLDNSDGGTRNLTVNGNVPELSSEAANVIVNGRIDDLKLEHCKYVELGEVPKKLYLDLGGVSHDSLEIPDGVEELKILGYKHESLEIPDGLKCFAIRGDNLKSLEIPDEMEYLQIESDPLESLKIPDGVKYLHIDSESLESLEIPDGLKYLVIESDSLGSLEIPDGVRYLVIISNTIDFDSMNIPEGILYYKLISHGRNETREYQAENCPEEWPYSNYWAHLGEFPDLSAY